MAIFIPIFENIKIYKIEFWECEVGWFNILKSIGVTYLINRIKEKISLIDSMTSYNM